jgi:signal transduction histidine kinase/FixJ family two-component response regulator
MAASNASARADSSKTVGWIRYAAELSLVGLLAVTALVIGFQRQIFARDVLISPATAGQFQFNGYADEVGGGRSTFTAMGAPLRWRCHVRPSQSPLFCGYEIVLDAYDTKPGTDLRNLEALVIDLEYQGPGATARAYLKNRDARYSDKADRASNKVNKAEFTVRNGRQTVVVSPLDFSVADWWLNGKDLPPELRRTQFDEVISVELSTGNAIPPGEYEFRVHSIVLKRSLITHAQLYQGVLTVWAVAILLYLMSRFRRAQREALALAEAKAAAERASQVKSDFLASMSHELRTPLNAVLGYAQLLLRSGLPEEHAGPVRTIHRSGKHLLSLITDLLDLSKIEAGKMELRPAPADLRGLISGVAEMIGVRAQDKGLTFRCEIDEKITGAVLVDAKRLRQILLNLLSNAVKFTEEGRVALIVRQLAGADGAMTIRFEVQDSGPGIAEHELEVIFSRYEQVGKVASREGGTGLGLAISRQFAQLMGSNIHVHSRVGHGAVFWFDLTLPSAELPPKPLAPDAASPKPAAAQPGRRLRVLAAEDNLTNQHVLRAMLQAFDVELTMASDGAEAIEAFEAGEFDLVLMDVQMPGVSGLEATRAIRRREAECSRAPTPIFALSADVAPEHLASYRDAGMDGHLDKPIIIEDLYLLLQKASEAAPVLAAEDRPPEPREALNLAI